MNAGVELHTLWKSAVFLLSWTLYEYNSVHLKGHIHWLENVSDLMQIIFNYAYMEVCAYEVPVKFRRDIRPSETGGQAVVSHLSGCWES